jgi:hypothetical protein
MNLQFLARGTNPRFRASAKPRAAHGRFKLKRVASKKKMQAKLKSVKTELRKRMHHSIPEQVLSVT